MNEGVKKDQEKLRLDLIPDTTIDGLGRVLTFGANKYGDRNWENGIKWSRIIGALERHLNAIKRREDIDPESGLLHSEHVLANASFLNHYFHTYPEGDDRPDKAIKHRQLGLDIDGVLANFLKGFKKKFPDIVDKNNWVQGNGFQEKIATLSDDFWLSLEPLVDPSDLLVEPMCYITKREYCSQKAVEQWLKNNGFPTAPVHMITGSQLKSEIAKSVGVEVFVDDNIHNYTDLNNNGILCFLMHQPHNAKHDVGYKRIYNLRELVTRFRLF